MEGGRLRRLAPDYGKKKTTMELLKSKTVLAALGFFALAITVYLKSDDLNKAVELILTGVGFLGLRQALTK